MLCCLLHESCSDKDNGDDDQSNEAVDEEISLEWWKIKRKKKRNMNVNAKQVAVRNGSILGNERKQFPRNREGRCSRSMTWLFFDERTRQAVLLVVRLLLLSPFLLFFVCLREPEYGQGSSGKISSQRGRTTVSWKSRISVFGIEGEDGLCRAVECRSRRVIGCRWCDHAVTSADVNGTDRPG